MNATIDVARSASLWKTEWIFSPAEVRSMLGLTRSRIEYLVHAGVVRPHESLGQGIDRCFSFQNLFEFSLATALEKCGLDVQSIGFIFDGLREDTRQGFSRVQGDTPAEWLVVPIKTSRYPDDDATF